MGDGFYRSKDPTNSIKVLKENLKNTNQNNGNNTKHTYRHTIIDTKKDIHKKHSKSPSLH